MNNHGMLTLQLLFMNDQSTVLWLDFSIHECCILLVLHEKCFSCQCCLIHQSDPGWRRCSWITWGLFIGSKSLYWNYCTGQKNGVHAFGYNSAESEPIWMKSGTLWGHCCWLAMADLGRDPCSSDSWRGSWNFVFLSTPLFFCFLVLQAQTRHSLDLESDQFWQALKQVKTCLFDSC